MHRSLHPSHPTDDLEDRERRDQELNNLFEQYAVSHDRRVREEIVERTAWIATRCARRFTHRGEPFEDLHQVAHLGLLKAIERFDPAQGHHFAAFAMPTILGELRRYFRDHTWSIHVPRRAKDVRPMVNGAVDDLTAVLGRKPTVDEIAQRIDHPATVVSDALAANEAYRARSLDTGHHRDVDVEDTVLSHVDDRHVVAELMSHLDERERKILYLRYFEELSQAHIAEIVGVSQVHVGRLLATSLERLRRVLVPEVAG